jgi:hypothetical protein
VSPCLKFLSQIKKVVDLSVADNPYRTVFVVNRLMATSDVDDTEPTHAESNGTVRINTFVVRATIDNRSAHFM